MFHVWEGEEEIGRCGDFVVGYSEVGGVRVELLLSFGGEGVGKVICGSFRFWIFLSVLRCYRLGLGRRLLHVWAESERWSE